MILLFVNWSEEYGSFRDKIPNGHKVPHPCNPSTIWNGVGHKAQGGGGERNPFGLDFYSQGKVSELTFIVSKKKNPNQPVVYYLFTNENSLKPNESTGTLN